MKINKLVKLLIPLLLLATQGCSSTGPIAMGKNHYSISKTSAACGFRDAGGVRTDLYKEMNEFCDNKNLYAEVTSLEALDGVIGKRCASATVEFRCVRDTGDDNTKPSNQKPDRDMNRAPEIPADRGQFGKK